MADEVGARLLAGLARVVRAGRSLEAHAAPSDEVPQSVITALGLLNEAGEMRPGHLAATLGLDPSVVSRTIAVAEARGLVARRPDPRDGRACLFSLTARGDECLTERRNRRLRLLATVVDEWEPEAAATLLAGLDRLHDGLVAARERETVRHPGTSAADSVDRAA